MNSKYIGTQVEDLLDKVNNPDTSVAENSTNLITSGAVYAALESLGLISVYSGTATPTSATGEDGDIYVQL